jgi:hypothetical protein
VVGATVYLRKANGLTHNFFDHNDTSFQQEGHQTILTMEVVHFLLPFSVHFQVTIGRRA